MFKLATPYLKKGRMFDYQHTKELLVLVDEIIKGDGLDETVIVPALIFHDTGWGVLSSESKNDYHSAGSREDHMEKGAELANKILTDIGYPKEKIEQITHLVSVHDYPSSSINKPLYKKDEFAIAGIDFLWRATSSGFNKDLNESGRSAEDQIAILRSGASKRNMKSLLVLHSLFEKLLNDRLIEVKK